MDEEISSSSSSRAEKASKREQRFHERIATLLIEKQAQKEQKNEQKEQDHGGLLLDMKEVNSIFAQASKLLFLDTEELEKAEQHNEDIQQLSKHMVEQCQTHNL